MLGYKQVFETTIQKFHNSMNEPPSKSRSAWQRYGLAMLISIIGLVAFLGILLAYSQVGTKPHDNTVKDCPTSGPTQVLSIQDNRFQPQTLTVERCDQVKIINLDNRVRDPALGEHDHHLAYPGFTEQELTQNESTTFTAGQSGTFRVHDHNDDTVEATLIIK